MLLATAVPAPLAAQGTGGVGNDPNSDVKTNPFPGPRGVNINGTVHTTPGRLLGGQDDVPADEQLREPDIIDLTATASGSGGGPIFGGGTCTPSQVTIPTQVTLPGVALHMDPPAPGVGGLGGVVTVPTYFWSAFLGDPNPSFDDAKDYHSCTPHQVLGETFWTPETHTLTMHTSSVPIGYLWNFGDGDVGVV